jgi:ribonuclease HI
MLRGNRVWVRCGPDGAPSAGADGRVDIAYKLAANAPLYRAAARNLAPTGEPGDEIPREADGGEPSARAEARTAEPARPSAGEQSAPRARAGAPVPPAASAGDAIIVYTDGACTGNPGPAGLGAVILDGGTRRELSEYLGRATNNIAELAAIQRALEAIPPGQRQRPIHLHTDSSYSIGVLSKGWQAKANQQLIAAIRRLVAQFPRLTLIKVKGHAGVPENERADELAREAIAIGAD